MAELAGVCEANNIEVSQSALRSAIVYDPFPKYMADVQEDYQEDLEAEIEKAQKTLQMRWQKDSDSEYDEEPQRGLNEQSPDVTPRQSKLVAERATDSRGMESDRSGSQVGAASGDGRESGIATPKGSQGSPSKKKKKKRSRKRRLPPYPEAGVNLKNPWDYEIDD